MTNSNFITVPAAVLAIGEEGNEVRYIRQTEIEEISEDLEISLQEAAARYDEWVKWYDEQEYSH